MITTRCNLRHTAGKSCNLHRRKAIFVGTGGIIAELTIIIIPPTFDATSAQECAGMTLACCNLCNVNREA